MTRGANKTSDFEPPVELFEVRQAFEASVPSLQTHIFSVFDTTGLSSALSATFEQSQGIPGSMHFQPASPENIVNEFKEFISGVFQKAQTKVSTSFVNIPRQTDQSPIDRPLQSPNDTPSPQARPSSRPSAVGIGTPSSMASPRTPPITSPAATSTPRPIAPRNQGSYTPRSGSGASSPASSFRQSNNAYLVSHMNRQHALSKRSTIIESASDQSNQRLEPLSHPPTMTSRFPDAPGSVRPLAPFPSPTRTTPPPTPNMSHLVTSNPSISLPREQSHPYAYTNSQPHQQPQAHNYLHPNSDNGNNGSGADVISPGFSGANNMPFSPPDSRMSWSAEYPSLCQSDIDNYLRDMEARNAENSQSIDSLLEPGRQTNWTSGGAGGSGMPRHGGSGFGGMGNR